MTPAPGKAWDDGLSGSARRIAGTDASPLRVLAGPGTGKTYTMMRRVTRLLQEGAPPHRIFVSTFTRTAASDLKRAVGSLGVDGAEKVRAETLHAYCFSLLSKADVLEKTGREPRPLLDFEERVLLEDLGGAHFGSIHDRRRRLRAFNAAWARLQSETPGWPTDPVDQAFQAALLGWLRFHKAILIGEIVTETLRYLRDNPASPYRRMFDHVLVDEFQDLNRAEQDLLDLIAENGAYAIIADDDQSIYAFKHAHPEGVIAFHESHAGTVDETLDECFRLPKRVVEMANKLISYNTNRTPRALRPVPTNPDGEVHIVQWQSIEAEAGGIAQFVKARIDAGAVEAGKVLILAPRRQFGYAVRDALNALGVEAHSFFNEESLEEQAAQDGFCLLTLLADPDDRVSVRCLCASGSSSKRVAAWARLREHCQATGESPREALDRLLTGDLNLTYTKGLVDRYREIKARVDALRPLKGRALLDALFPDGKDWAEPFRVAALGIKEEDFGAPALRERLTTSLIQRELPTEAVPYVRVMSYHKSKGLTADLVVVAGCVQGLMSFVEQGLPIEEENRAREEQRRLFYVTITRGRQTLVISSVAEVPPDLAHRLRLPAGAAGPWATVASEFVPELGAAAPKTITGPAFLRRVGVSVTL